MFPDTKVHTAMSILAEALKELRQMEKERHCTDPFLLPDREKEEYLGILDRMYAIEEAMEFLAANF